MTLNRLLAKLDLGEVGGGDIPVTGINTLLQATGEEVSFVEEKRYLQQLNDSNAAAVFINHTLKEKVPGHIIAIPCNSAKLTMAKATHFFKKTFENLPDGSASISKSAVLYPNVVVGRNTVIKEGAIIMSGVFIGDNCTIGAKSVIHANTVVYHGTVIGERTAIHAGSVIGSDGFGYVRDENGANVKIHHNGNVIIEDDVEIAANTVIDRAVFSSTVIGKGTKIDNLVNIAHNVTVGSHTVIAGQTGIAGSTAIGSYVTMAAQCGAVDHIEIADGTIVAARGGITKNTEKGKIYAGFPAVEIGVWRKMNALLSRMAKKK